jgi:translation elongation factor EF-G
LIGLLLLSSFFADQVWTCKQSLENRLGATPLLLYMPVGESSKLTGFIDLLSMQYITFGDDKGKTVHRVALTSSSTPGNSPSEPTHASPEHANENNRTFVFIDLTRPFEIVVDHICHFRIWQDAVLARERLIEKLADLDDELASMYLDQPELLHWEQKDSLKMLKRAIRKATVECRAVPIICASAFKNKGLTAF